MSMPPPATTVKLLKGLATVLTSIPTGPRNFTTPKVPARMMISLWPTFELLRDLPKVMLAPSGNAPPSVESKVNDGTVTTTSLPNTMEDRPVVVTVATFNVVMPLEPVSK